MLMLRTGAGDAERIALAVTIVRPSSADHVVHAVNAYSDDGRSQVYVERTGDSYRWSPAHRGGPAPLMHLVARFLGCETTDLTVGFVTVDSWCIVRSPDELPPDRQAIVDTGAVMTTDALVATLDG